MPDNSGDAPSGLAEDRIAALYAGFAGLAELLEALRIWEEWAHLSGPGFSVQPSPGLSPIPQPYDISSDETHRQLIARLHWTAASAAQPPGEEDLRLLDEAGVAAYDVSNKHRRDFLAFIRLNASNDADARTKTVAQVVRRSHLKPGFADYDPNEKEDNDDEPPSRARRRRPSGRRPRPDFRPTTDDADKGKGKGKA
eukprot:jgi/Tetstr1/465248/TSEL_009950.t1